MTTECLIKRTDDELQIVYGEVYAPNIPDVHGEFMTPVEVRKMAHRFMQKRILNAVDTNHDNELNGSYIVESFVVDEEGDDSIYLSGAWVIGMHVPDPEVWEAVKSGEINGFSMEAFVVSQLSGPHSSVSFQIRRCRSQTAFTSSTSVPCCPVIRIRISSRQRFGTFGLSAGRMVRKVVQIMRSAVDEAMGGLS